MPTNDQRKRCGYAACLICLPIGLCFLVTGCQSTKLAQVPGMGWLGSEEQPPVLQSDNGLPAYPPPSAAATPTSLGESKATGPGSGVASAPKSASKSYPPTGLGSAGQQSVMTRSSTPATQTDTFAGSSTAAGDVTASAGSTKPPVGLPPGVTAPNLRTEPPDVQRGPYAEVAAPQTPAPTSLAGGSSVEQTPAPPDYPMPDSGSATTWDYQNSTNNAVVDRSGGDFEPSNSSIATAAASPSTTANVQAIPASIPQASPPAQASHYESLAQQQIGARSGPWRPGSTTQYVVNGAVTTSTATSQVQAIPTADLSGGSSARASDWQ